MRSEHPNESGSVSAEPVPLNILELVDLLDCGLPRHEREARVVLTLSWKSFFDESSDGRQNEYYVVAGIIAERHEWKRLYRSWDKARIEGKPIAYYSGKEGSHTDRAKPGTIFYGWSDEEIETKRLQLAAAIRAHHPHCRMITGSTTLDDFKRIMKTGDQLPPAWDDPHLPCVATSLIGVANYMEERGSGGPVKQPLITFDTPSSLAHRDRIRMVYDEYMAAAQGESAYRVSKWLDGNPRFCLDDKAEPGIQMADLIAGAMRSTVGLMLKRNSASRDLVASPVLAALSGDHRGAMMRPIDIAVWKKAMFDLLKKRGVI